MRVTDNFFGKKREWSRLKDEILATYLRPYLSKITRTGRPVLIVDCFAGKGEFDDGEPGSPLLICRAIHQATSLRPDAAIKALFIEKKYYLDLAKNVSPWTDCEVLPGAFEEHIRKLANELKAGTNMLLFVDPYGIKSLDFSLFRYLLDMDLGPIELILNFNTFGFLREGCRLLSITGFDLEEDSDVYEDDPDSPNSVERMNAIASGAYWQDILRKYRDGTIDMKTAEAQFASAYLERVHRLFEHVVEIPVKFRRHHLPKYRLIHGTQSPDGLILMADKMSRVWRNFVERDRGGQEVLFEEIDYPDMVALENYSLEADILSYTESWIGLKDLLVSLLSKYGITYSSSRVTSSIKAMEQEGALVIQRCPAKTPGGRITKSMDYRQYRITVKRA